MNEQENKRTNERMNKRTREQKNNAGTPRHDVGSWFRGARLLMLVVWLRDAWRSVRGSVVPWCLGRIARRTAGASLPRYRRLVAPLFRGSWFSVFVALFPRFFVLSVLVPLFLCSVVLASPHTLTVTLRDVGGAGIAGAAITVRDEAGSIDLAHTTTDAQGVATLPNLTTDIVRVAVSGFLADGTPLNQRGQDAHGIWVLLDAPLVQLDLRSEVHGDILPDPTTMISADGPIPATPDAPMSAAISIMTEAPSSAVIVPTAAVASVPTAIPFDTTQSNVNEHPPAAQNRWLVLAGALMLILVLLFSFVWERRVSR